MRDRQAFERRFREILDGPLGRPEIHFDYPGTNHTGFGVSWRAVIRVVSDRFEGEEDYLREERVYRLVVDELTEAEQDMIEYIYTEAPSEQVESPAES